MTALRTALGALAVAGLVAGCSHEHGPLSDKPDTTSLGVAGGLGEGAVSTAYGLAPDRSDAKGVDTDLSDRNTAAAVRPPPLVPGMPRSAEVPVISNAMQSWSSGPTLPVERANMALEPEGGAAKPEAHGAGSGHKG